MLSYIFSNKTSIEHQPQVYIQDNACSLLNDNIFQEKWDKLYEDCEWATVFQKKEFILTWYQVNANEYSPIIVFLIQDDKLLGLLCLATKKKKKGIEKQFPLRIIGAGAYDAEYQVWISKREDSDYFISSALKILFEEFPKSNLFLRFIPDSTIVNVITESKEWNNHAVPLANHRPLMDFSLTDEQKLFKKRHLKAKYNRISRVGKIELKEITDSKEFDGVLKEVLVFLDFRQAYMFNKLPSKKEPNKPLFLKSLFEKDLLHVSVLILENEIISSIIGMKDKKWVHLAGLISYSPFYAKHSPALVHFFLLGQLMKDQGFNVFDLTPGYDAYKERISTSSDEVIELTISKNPSFKLKKSIRKLLHTSLLKFNIRPMSFKLKIKRMKYMLKNKPIKLINSINISLHKADQHNDFLLENHEFSKNSLAALLCFSDKNSDFTKWEYLQKAASYIEEGHHFYTISSNDLLEACVWFEAPSEDVEKPKILSTYFHPSIEPFKDQIISHIEVIINK
ncbi:GNAT family N-acetyltransferase [Echinicola sp. CAU 1574]|uniref:GNAT family N-acetyltransferase n=1 Tax=Echinicola arenosa TaxID=2774144 RepID=A0ABR9ANW4_9BACT|nr:GNAT family N-acetyltransferase [Echinicola arenosa]MBD8490481.1 GNAT family N-acetyltransferase [Echinicola arenosa]